VATPSPSPAPFITFVPDTITVRASKFDYFGELTYSGRAGLVPQPVSPASGYLACDRGFSVALRVHAGPAPIGVVHDEYLVLPLSVSPAKGTILTCSATWGLFDGGTLVAQAPLHATVIYDTGKPAIYFNPRTLAFKSSDGTTSSVLAYATTADLKVEPISPKGGILACDGGYTLTTRLKAGGVLQGYVQDNYVVDPDAVAPKPAVGQTLTCSSTWGLADSHGDVVQTAKIAVSLTYDVAP
jgi:hypothetical protein